MKSEKRKIAIIAGEVSGDKIGSDLVSEIALVNDIDLYGVGGEELAKHGLRLSLIHIPSPRDNR